jgi:enoyl-CoA hydratase
MSAYSQYNALIVKKDTERKILTITLSNPGKKNAITREMDRELGSIFDDAWADDDVNVIVLTGDGDSFCAGADVSNLQTYTRSKDLKGPSTRSIKRVFFSMLDCEKPIIAKVRGPAYGLGVNLALACDIVVADESAKFCDSHTRMGIAPGDGGAALWPLLIGFSRAKEYLMTGEPIEASRAEQIGLINHCVTPQELDGKVDAIVDKLAKGAPLAIRYAKSSVNVMLKQMVSAAFEASMAYDLLTLKTEDHQEAVASFLEKRSPTFNGR